LQSPADINHSLKGEFLVKKLIYGIVAAGVGVAFAVQPVAADSTQFWNGENYQGVADLPFPAVTSAADLARTVVAPGSAPLQREDAHAAADAGERTRARHDQAPARQMN
jgi:hypothetical protein